MALICACAVLPCEWRICIECHVGCRVRSGEGVGCLICGTLCLPSQGLWKFGQVGCLRADSSDWRYLCGLPRKINQFPKAAKTWPVQRELEPLFLYQEQMKTTVSYVTYNSGLCSIPSTHNLLFAKLVKHTAREENWIQFLWLLALWLLDPSVGCYWAECFQLMKWLTTAKKDRRSISDRGRKSHFPI
jgi:uncharacterized membrane protein YfbV (UPF0208 family)